MPKIQLTQSIVDTATCPKSQAKVDYFDTKTPGLMLKIHPSGNRSYSIRYKTERGKTVEKRFSDAKIVKLSDARQWAKENLAKIEMGEDPFAKKATLKDVPTFAEFVADSYMPHAKSYKL
ncbi:MAG: Arm DNA-binding domain-containing protein [Marinobacter sp.]|jgi:hypothetical protein|nr:Arm DNA-binding domain-containing protein [Marinobacter sp.]MCL1481506.1 Arm DNA-binding domain-containing protein [Marinobacter sp.]